MPITLLTLKPALKTFQGPSFRGYRISNCKSVIREARGQPTAGTIRSRPHLYLLLLCACAFPFPGHEEESLLFIFSRVAVKGETKQNRMWLCVCCACLPSPESLLGRCRHQTPFFPSPLPFPLPPSLTRRLLLQPSQSKCAAAISLAEDMTRPTSSSYRQGNHSV